MCQGNCRRHWGWQAGCALVYPTGWDQHCLAAPYQSYYHGMQVQDWHGHWEGGTGHLIHGKNSFGQMSVVWSEVKEEGPSGMEEGRRKSLCSRGS